MIDNVTRNSTDPMPCIYVHIEIKGVDITLSFKGPFLAPNPIKKLRKRKVTACTESLLIKLLDSSANY